MTNTIKILKYILKINPIAETRPLLDNKKQYGMRMSHPIIVSMGGLPYEFMQYRLLEKFLRASGFWLIRGSEDMSLACLNWCSEKHKEKINSCVA